jgi:hypothetical protein
MQTTPIHSTPIGQLRGTKHCKFVHWRTAKQEWSRTSLGQEKKEEEKREKKKTFNKKWILFFSFFSFFFLASNSPLPTALLALVVSDKYWSSPGVSPLAQLDLGRRFFAGGHCVEQSHLLLYAAGGGGLRGGWLRSRVKSGLFFGYDKKKLRQKRVEVTFHKQKMKLLKFELRRHMFIHWYQANAPLTFK